MHSNTHARRYRNPGVALPRQLAPVVELQGFRRQQKTNRWALALMIACLGLFTGMLVTYVVNPAIKAAAHSNPSAWAGTER